MLTEYMTFWFVSRHFRVPEPFLTLSGPAFSVVRQARGGGGGGLRGPDAKNQS